MANNDLPIKPSGLETTGEIVAIAFNAVPVVGGVISDTANSFIKSRQNARLNKFLLDIASDLKDVKVKIDKNSEEYQNLVEDIFSKAAECRQKGKLEAYKALFNNSTLGKTYMRLKYIRSLADAHLSNV